LAIAIEKIAETPYQFLKYFKRNLSESGFSADKKKFSWLLRGRKEVALFAVSLWRNIFAIVVKNYPKPDRSFKL